LYQQLDSVVIDLKQNSRIDKERHKREYRKTVENIYIKRRDAYKHVVTRWGNIIELYRSSIPKTKEEDKYARKINYMYNHTKLPPINPVKKDVINTRKKEMYHKIEFEIFPDREEAPGGENAALLKEMNENL